MAFLLSFISTLPPLLLSLVSCYFHTDPEIYHYSKKGTSMNNIHMVSWDTKFGHLYGSLGISSKIFTIVCM